jgi:hypothetical protein
MLPKTRSELDLSTLIMTDTVEQCSIKIGRNFFRKRWKLQICKIGLHLFCFYRFSAIFIYCAVLCCFFFKWHIILDKQAYNWAKRKTNTCAKNKFEPKLNQYRSDLFFFWASKDFSTHQLKTVFLKTRLVLPHKIQDLDNMQINKC